MHVGEEIVRIRGWDHATRHQQEREEEEQTEGGKERRKTTRERERERIVNNHALSVCDARDAQTDTHKLCFEADLIACVCDCV